MGDKKKGFDERELTGDERRAALGEQQNGLANPDLPSERERLGNVRKDEEPADEAA